MNIIALCNWLKRRSDPQLRTKLYRQISQERGLNYGFKNSFNLFANIRLLSKETLKKQITYIRNRLSKMMEFNFGNKTCFQNKNQI